MATAIIQFRVNGGAVQTGTATVAADDEIAFLASSYAGWQAARWELQEYPADYPAPAGWSTDGSSGAYYYDASPIAGLTPPNITMPSAAEISAGQWGKWIARVIVTTASGTITSDPRVMLKIPSPQLGLNGIAFTEEAESNTQRAWPGDMQEDLVLIDDAALVSGGFVSALAASAPIAVSGSTGSVTISWSPSANVALGGYKITSLGTPSASTDAATKGYVDTVAQGLDIKGSVRVATTANITLSGEQTIDGVAVVAGERVLAKNQSTASQNGIYVCAVGSWTRATDLAAASSAAGAFCFVEEGTTNADKGFVCTSNVGSDVVGTNSLAWTQFTGAGSGLDSLTAVLENTATALNANGVPIQDLPAALTFYRDSGGYAATVGCGSASAPGTYDALRIIATDSGGTGGVDRVAGLLFANQDADGDEPSVARVGSYLSDATNGATAGGLLFYTSTGGALALAATLDASKVLTTVGKMASDAGFDASTATALPIGGTATSITHSLASTLQYTLSSAAMTWANNLTTPTYTIAARTTDAATTELRFTGQTPWASATGTNRNPGDIRFTIASPAAGGAEGFFRFTLSGADVVRIGRPSGTFETEVRYSNAAVVHRNNTISGGTMEMFTGGFIVSTSNFYNRDSSQTLRYTRNITTAIADTYDASNTAISETWTQDASAAGGTWTRTGQRGATGFAGGSLVLTVGDGGTLGTNAPGNLDVGLGTPVSSVSGYQRWLTTAGSVIAQLSLNTGSYARLESGAAASGGWYITGAAVQTVSAGTISVESTGSQFWINTVDAETRFYDSGTLARTDKSVNGGASSMQWSGVTTSVTVSIAAPTSTGATAGRAMSIAAGAGQQQTGANNNNNGGALALASGAAGTGGSGTAGTPGDVTIATGATTQVTISTTRAAFTNRVEAPRFVGEVSTPTSSGAAVTISLDAQNPEHTTTENTTVTISGGTVGQTGTILFTQGAVGRTVTMPTNGVGVEYGNTIAALTVTGIVDATALTRTILSYRILANGKAYIHARDVNTIP